MQTLDIISINIWQMLISLANLVILFLIVKKFLYNPVKKMLEKRQQTIDTKYSEAEQAKNKALSDKQSYEEKLLSAKQEADSLIQSAVDIARSRENTILLDAKQKADGILRQAQQNAELETKKAEKAIKDEIVKVSTLIAGKMLEREVNEKDHKQIIDSFIEEIGEENEGN
ncbi:MAG: F0F1 ATP synthase subunit B [Clostridia bacterium]|nr:F0F1 ATP synthase subunit B [Clostridia bacterium]